MKSKFSCHISINSHNKGSRTAELKPQGFWTKTITIFQDNGFGGGVWRLPKISWSSGGQDGSLSSIECAKSFANGIINAIEIACEWNKDTGKQI